MNQFSGTFHSATNATSSTDSAAGLVVKGGAAVAKDVFVGGSVAFSSIRTTSAAFQMTTGTLTLTASDGYYMIECTFAGSATITLPLASAAPGKQYFIAKRSSNANSLTINVSGSDTIDGVDTSITSLTDPFNRVRLTSNGVATWYSG